MGLQRLFDSLSVSRYLAVMKKNLYLLAGIIFLYLASSAVLQGIYGQSFGFLNGEDYWAPDNAGGWVKHGNPTSPMPVEPSVDVPVLVRYIPIFLPATLLILFYLTPLSRLIEPPPPKEEAAGDLNETADDNPKSV